MQEWRGANDARCVAPCGGILLYIRISPPPPPGVTGKVVVDGAKLKMRRGGMGLGRPADDGQTIDRGCAPSAAPRPPPRVHVRLQRAFQQVAGPSNSFVGGLHRSRHWNPNHTTKCRVMQFQPHKKPANKETEEQKQTNKRTKEQRRTPQLCFCLFLVSARLSDGGGRLRRPMGPKFDLPPSSSTATTPPTWLGGAC